MKIKFHPTEGPVRTATLPYPECRHVIVRGCCPVCTDKKVIIAHDIHETVIFDEKDRARATKHLTDRGAAVDLLEEMPAQHEWLIKGIDPVLGEYSVKAKAVCLRCRSRIGEIVTEFGTLFGRTEDNLVLGCCGIVIGGLV